jgi:hypothetical protein
MQEQSMRNAIINGDMRIAQRGTSFAAIANGAYSLDRWQYGKVGTMVHTITQDTDIPNNQFRSSLKLDVTTADAAMAAGDVCIVQQKIEGYNFRKLMDQTATLSFWVKAGKTGTLCVSFRNSGLDRSYVVETTIDSANTWEQKSITLVFNESGGTWDYANGTGLIVGFVLAAGSSWQTTADAWQTGNYVITSSQTNFVDNTDATCDVWITGVQLELGDTATDFEFLDYESQLFACYRYYYESSSSEVGVTCYAASGTNYHTPVAFLAPMRAPPTFAWTQAVPPNGFPVGAPTWQAIGTTGARPYKTCNSTGNGRYYYGQYRADAEL